MSDISQRRSIIALVLLILAVALFGLINYEHAKHLQAIVRKSVENDNRLQKRIEALEKASSTIKPAAVSATTNP